MRIKYIYKTLLMCSIVLVSFLPTHAQNQTGGKTETIRALNSFVLYVNEVNNYLPIINSLMVDYNMKLNKFVDLPSHEPSLFTNALFPDNLFDDVIYHYSPNGLYKNAVQYAEKLPSADKQKILTIAGSFQQNTTFINSARFEVENLLTTLDLTKRENVSKVYDKMESVAAAFKKSKKLQYELEYQLKASFKNQGFSNHSGDKIHKSFEDIYSLSRLMIEAVYENNQRELPDLKSHLLTAWNQFNEIDMTAYNGTFWMNPISREKLKNIKQKTKELLGEIDRYSRFENLPEKYQLYGSNYYYYNHAFLVKLDRFGMGIAAEINEIYVQNNQDKLLYMELPYDYKVVYPRVIREEMFLPASTTFIQAIPQKVQDREVVKADRMIEVDKIDVEFEVYDHKIIDNDIVSILFNGEWILEKFKISDKKHNFKIKLNENGVNYLLLHADEEGRRPPATIALAYYTHQGRQQIILNSDKLKSELIEIKLKEEK